MPASVLLCFFNAFAVALNVFALSDTIKLGAPLLAQNRLNALRNVCAERSSTNSKCKALLPLTFKGPAKSTPTLENGGAS